MQYASLVLVLLSNLVAIRGETWDSQKTGFKRITITGLITLSLAIIGFFLSIAMVYQSNVENEENKVNLIAAKENTSKTADEVVALKAKISAYQEVIEQIRDYSERQEQLVMIQAIQLGPGETWQSPNKLYSGSKIEVYFFAGDSVELNYGNQPQSLRRGSDDWARIFVIGDSGKQLRWSLKNLATTSFLGKVAVFSTPRSRSRDWSWIEERIDNISLEKKVID